MRNVGEPIRRALDEDRRIGRIGHDRGKVEDGLAVGAALTVDALDREAPRLRRSRQQLPASSDDFGGAGIWRPWRDHQLGLQMDGDADLVTDADVERQTEIDGGGGIGDRRGEEEDKAILEDIGDAVAVIIAFGHREAYDRRIDVDRGREVDPRSNAGVAGTAPIGLPAGRQLYLDRGLEASGGIGAGCDQPDARPVGFDPVADRRPGRRGGEERGGDQHRNDAFARNESHAREHRTARTIRRQTAMVIGFICS